MLIHPATRFDSQLRRLRRAKALAGGVACLYLLFSAFLILCLAHPLDNHSHGDTDHHFDVACLWVQKAVSSHAPSANATLTPAEAVVCAAVPFLFVLRQVRLIPRTGRSPPTLAIA